MRFMALIKLRKDLDPWPCDKCANSVFEGVTMNYRFYCVPCGIEVEEANEGIYHEEPEVNFEEEV